MYFWCIYVKREKGFEVCNKKCIFLRFNLFFYLKKKLFVLRDGQERKEGSEMEGPKMEIRFSAFIGLSVKLLNYPLIWNRHWFAFIMEGAHMFWGDW